MGSAMAYTIKSIAYQFKSNEIPDIANNTKNMNLEKKINNTVSNNIPTNSMQTNVINKRSENVKEKTKEKNSVKDGIVKTYNIGKDVMKLGRYVADGQPVNVNTLPNKFRRNNNENVKSDNRESKDDVFKIKEDDANEK